MNPMGLLKKYKKDLMLFSKSGTPYLHTLSGGHILARDFTSKLLSVLQKCSIKLQTNLK